MSLWEYCLHDGTTLAVTTGALSSVQPNDTKATAESGGLAPELAGEYASARD